MSDSTTATKTCPKCKEVFLLSSEYFYRNKSNKNGFSRYCKTCADTCRHVQEYVPKPDTLKTCTKCRRDYPETTEFFPLHKGRSNGLGDRCHECNRKHVDTHKKADPEKTKKLRHAEYLRNRDRYMTSSQRYYRSKSEVNLAACRRYRSNHIDRVRLLSRASQARRRVKKITNGGDHTIKDIELQYKSQKGLCWWCGKKVGNAYHVDHRIPLDKGGSNNPDNLCISCPRCNLSKNNKMPWEFNGRLL